jgi:hypothetical protein
MPRRLPVVVAALLTPFSARALPLQGPSLSHLPNPSPVGIDLPVGGPGLGGPPFLTPVGPPDGVPPHPDVPPIGGGPPFETPPVQTPVGPPTAIPEPATALLLLGGLAALNGRAQRGRRGAAP